MPAESPQAQLPAFRSAGDALQAQTQAQRLNVDAPSVVVGNSTSVQLFADDPNVAYRSIQNAGTVPVNICVNMNAAANVAHFVLAPGTADFDGLGSQLDLSVFKGRITAFGTGAFTVITCQAKFPLTTV